MPLLLVLLIPTSFASSPETARGWNPGGPLDHVGHRAITDRVLHGHPSVQVLGGRRYGTMDDATCPLLSQFTCRIIPASGDTDAWDGLNTGATYHHISFLIGAAGYYAFLARSALKWDWNCWCWVPDYEARASYLGRLAHYLEDASQPLHTEPLASAISDALPFHGSCDAPWSVHRAFECDADHNFDASLSDFDGKGTTRNFDAADVAPIWYSYGAIEMATRLGGLTGPFGPSIRDMYHKNDWAGLRACAQTFISWGASGVKGVFKYNIGTLVTQDEALRMLRAMYRWGNALSGQNVTESRQLYNDTNNSYYTRTEPLVAGVASSIVNPYNTGTGTVQHPQLQPLILILDHPYIEPDQPVTVGTIVMNWGDSAPPADVELRIDGTLMGTGQVLTGRVNASSIGWSWTPPEGSHTIQITVDPRGLIDERGTLANGTAVANKGDNVITQQVFIDATPPQISIITPQPISYSADQSLTLNFSAVDTLSGVGGLYGYLDNNQTQRVVSGLPLQLSELGPGVHTLTVIATDTNNNTATSTLSFTVLAALPTLTPPVTLAVILAVSVVVELTRRIGSRRVPSRSGVRVYS